MSEQYLTIEHLTRKEIARLLNKVHINPDRHYNGSSCWLKGNPVGYPGMRYKGIQHGAHCVMYAWIIGPLPSRQIRPLMHVDHLCRNRACINPSHLELVTVKTNVLRGEGVSAQNARKTQCKNGHPFSQENMAARKNPIRYCPICERKRYKTDAYREANKLRNRVWQKAKRLAVKAAKSSLSK